MAPHPQRPIHDNNVGMLEFHNKRHCKENSDSWPDFGDHQSVLTP